MSRPVSQIRLLRLVLGIRWAILASIPVLLSLGRQRPHDLPVVLTAIGGAALYTLLLTVFSKQVLALHRRGPLFSIIDLTVVSAIYATGPLTEWSFFFFGATTILIAGLRGRVWESLGVSVAFNLMASVMVLAWRLPIESAIGTAALDDLFNLSVLAAAWSFGVRTAVDLNAAYDDLQAGAEELARANAQLDEREHEILGLMEAGNAIVRESDLETVLGNVVDSLTSMGFGPCRVWVLEQDHFHAVFPSGDGIADVLASPGTPMADAVRERVPISVPGGSDTSIPGFEPDRLAIASPVMTQDEVLGVLTLESISGDAYDHDEIAMISLFADQVALALQHLRFLEQTQELAVAEERVRITREIHDTVVQKIYGANLIAEALCNETVEPPVWERLSRLQETILASLKDLRFAVLNWDSLGWRSGLTGLVERYSAEFAALTGIAVSVVLRGEDSLCRPSRSESTLQVLQAALSNVWRHAHAASVQVDLAIDATGIGLTVRDDGRGFDLSEVSGDGGIAEMRHRGQRSGGAVEIESAPGDGTTVRLWMPC